MQGVKGFDAAHNKAGEISETHRLVTVDGDNTVREDFFKQTIEIDEEEQKDYIFSWCGHNVINSLAYGNGGLKLWPKHIIENMNSHENDVSEDGAHSVDFCWMHTYFQMADTFSDVVVNANPEQAYRAGFREGVKMSLDQGTRIRPDEFKQKVWWQNYNRLQTWCNIGSDVENGLWAIYGARLGCEMTVLSDWDTNQISDFEWFKDFFNNEVAPQFSGFTNPQREEIITCRYSKLEWDKNLLQEAVCELGAKLNNEINEMMLFDPNDDMSKFFKTTYVNPRRWGVMIREKQIQDLLEKGLLS